MEFDDDNVRKMVEEDRLSSLPDELIHKILSCFDMKSAVQTCVLSSRWKLLWTSMSSLNFSRWKFSCLPKFSKFVTNVLSRRNHQIEVSSVKLDFDGAASQAFVRKIATYAFSHNAQQLMVCSWPKNEKEFPPYLFSSQSLKHFTLSCRRFCSPCVTPKTPWDFPAITTLHLSDITLSDDDSERSLDLFSKCVNLKNLTIKNFYAQAGGVCDKITPRLSNLTLIDSICRKDINLSAPQLENLTLIKCRIKYLSAPLRLSSLYYEGEDPIQLLKGRFHSLDKVSIWVYHSCSEFKEEDARKTINMLQQLHTAKYLTLNWNIIECISSFPDLLSQHPSPFSNLICLNSPNKRKNAYKVKMSTEARNFFLVNSPDAIMELPEESLTKEMKQKEAREKKKAKQTAEIESQIKELEALINQKNLVVERKEAKEKANAALKAPMAEVPQLSLQKIKMSLEKMKMKVYQGKVLIDSDSTAMNVEVEKGHIESERLMSRFKIWVEEMRALVKEQKEEAVAILAKEAIIRSLLESLPKRERGHRLKRAILDSLKKQKCILLVYSHRL